jgi:hypothetical protein
VNFTLTPQTASLLWSLLTSDKLWRYLPWALFVCTALAAYYTSRPVYSASDALNEMQRVHQLELAEIAQARDVERAELEANVRAYEATLSGIARDHQSQLDELNRGKVQRTTTLSRDYSGRPEALAEHMSRVLSRIGKE